MATSSADEKVDSRIRAAAGRWAATSTATAPPRLEYYLTNFGRALVPVVEAIAKCWKRSGRKGGTTGGKTTAEQSRVRLNA